MGLALLAFASPEGQNGPSGLAHASPLNPCTVSQENVCGGAMWQFEQMFYE